MKGIFSIKINNSQNANNDIYMVVEDNIEDMILFQIGNNVIQMTGRS